MLKAIAILQNVFIFITIQIFPVYDISIMYKHIYQ